METGKVRKKKPPRPSPKPPQLRRRRRLQPGQRVPNPEYDPNMDGVISTDEQRHGIGKA